MAKEHTAIVGVAEHGNSAELVTVAADATILDRRRVDLTTDLPTHPYHHEGAWALGRYRDSAWSRDITLPEAIALIEQVHQAADAGAAAHLAALAESIAVPISGVAVRVCPVLPATIEERLRDNRAQTMADSIMYREALAKAADARGWTVSWYDKKTVAAEAASAQKPASVESLVKAMGQAVGTPWQARHKLAATAALAALAVP